MVAFKYLFCWLFVLLYSHMPIAQPCAGVPKFVEEIGFDKRKIALSTSEGVKMGLVLVELGEGAAKKAERKSSYRHPSWDDEGYLSAITRDPEGNIYVAPKPNVNMYYTKEENINSVFRVDTETGVMKHFLSLPTVFPKSKENPFGIMDIRYDCSFDRLIVSTIFGSDRKHQRGMVYFVDVKTKVFEKILENQDVIGVCLLPSKDKFQLIYCNIRDQTIRGIKINKNQDIIDTETTLFSLEGVGPRGDDVARKIVYKNGELTIYGTPFYYNLTAPVFAPETIYTYQLNIKSNQWVLKNMR